MDFKIGDLVVVSAEDKVGIVIGIDLDPDGENHDVHVQCGTELISEFHHGIMPLDGNV